MQRYPVRATHRGKNTVPALEAILRTHFGTATARPDAVSAEYGAIKSLTVTPAGRELAVEVVMNPAVPDEVARETIARYNRFLEEATGYTSKERARRIRKSAGGAEGGS